MYEIKTGFYASGSTVIIFETSQLIARPEQFINLSYCVNRFCDNVWTFMLNDVEFREVQEVAKVDKVKIVACDGKSKFIDYFFFFLNQPTP